MCFVHLTMVPCTLSNMLLVVGHHISMMSHTLLKSKLSLYPLYSTYPLAG